MHHNNNSELFFLINISSNRTRRSESCLSVHG